MLDEKYREIERGMGFTDGLSHHRHLFCAHSSDGFVEDDYPRLGTQRSSEFHSLLHSVGKRSSRPVQHIVKAEELCHFMHARAMNGFVSPRAGGSEGKADDSGREEMMATVQQVLAHCSPAPERKILEGARHASPHEVVSPQIRHRCVSHTDLSGCRPVDARQQIEQRALACTIRSDESMDLALLNLEVHIRECDNTSELL
ncbi:hypothetical protein GCM10022383_06840 [Microbacterium soli]|uniref:Uncharacterized protein n=1 Tax=Microbacterium soli TaxID=446075 RepID=A0ABP7MV87_9MICO